MTTRDPVTPPEPRPGLRKPAEVIRNGPSTPTPLPAELPFSLDPVTDARPLTAVLVEAMMAHGVWQRYMRGGHVIDARKNAEALAEILAAALTPSEARALPSTPTDQRLADCEDALATVEAAYDRVIAERDALADDEQAAHEAASTPTVTFHAGVHEPMPDGRCRCGHPWPAGPTHPTRFIDCEVHTSLQSHEAALHPEPSTPTDREAALRAAAQALCNFAGRFSAGDSDVQRDDLQVAIDDVRAALADGLCLWPYTNKGETTYCGLYAGHPDAGVQYGHHFVAPTVLPAVIATPAGTPTDREAALREALHKAVESALTLSTDPVSRRERVHGVIDVVLAARLGEPR